MREGQGESEGQIGMSFGQDPEMKLYNTAEYSSTVDRDRLAAIDDGKLSLRQDVFSCLESNNKLQLI